MVHQMSSDVNSSHRRENSKAMRSLFSSWHGKKKGGENKSVDVSSWAMADLEQLLSGTSTTLTLPVVQLQVQPEASIPRCRQKLRRMRLTSKTKKKAADSKTRPTLEENHENRWNNSHNHNTGRCSSGKSLSIKEQQGLPKESRSTSKSAQSSRATSTLVQDPRRRRREDRKKETNRTLSHPRTKKTTAIESCKREVHKTKPVLKTALMVPSDDLKKHPLSVNDRSPFNRRHSITSLTCPSESRWSNGIDLNKASLVSLVSLPCQKLEQHKSELYETSSLTRRHSIASAARWTSSTEKHVRPETTITTAAPTTKASDTVADTDKDSPTLSPAKRPTSDSSEQADTFQSSASLRTMESRRSTRRSTNLQCPGDDRKRNKTFAAWRESLHRVANLPLTGEGYDSLQDPPEEGKKPMTHDKRKKKIASRPVLRRQDSTIAKRPSSTSSLDITTVLIDFDTAIRRPARPPTRHIPLKESHCHKNNTSSDSPPIELLQRRSMSCSPATSKRGGISGIHNFTRRSSIKIPDSQTQRDLPSSAGPWSIDSQAPPSISHFKRRASIATPPQKRNMDLSPVSFVASSQSASPLNRRSSIAATSRDLAASATSFTECQRQSPMNQGSSSARRSRNLNASATSFVDGSLHSPLNRRSNIAASQRNFNTSATLFVDGTPHSSPINQRTRIMAEQCNFDASSGSFAYDAQASPLNRHSNIETSQKYLNESAGSFEDHTQPSPLSRRSSIAGLRRDIEIPTDSWPGDSQTSPLNRRSSIACSSPITRQHNPRLMAQRLYDTTYISPIRKKVLANARTNPRLIIF